MHALSPALTSAEQHNLALYHRSSTSYLRPTAGVLPLALRPTSTGSPCTEWPEWTPLALDRARVERAQVRRLGSADREPRRSRLLLTAAVMPDHRLMADPRGDRRWGWPNPAVSAVVPHPRVALNEGAAPPPQARPTARLIDDQKASGGRPWDVDNWPWPRCPVRGHQKRQTSWGTWGWSLCLKTSCWACVPFVAVSYGRAIALARPDQFARVSLVGADWPTIRRNMNRLREHLRADGTGLQDVYHVEENPRGTGNHAHIWLWGPRVEDGQLAEAARRANLGLEVHLQAAYGGANLDYGMKAVIDRPDDAERMWPLAKRYLELNGGRLLHASRGFWRDAATGESFAGVRKAATAARRASVRQRISLGAAA